MNFLLILKTYSSEKKTESSIFRLSHEYFMKVMVVLKNIFKMLETLETW